MRIRTALLICRLTAAFWAGTAGADTLDPETRALYDTGTVHFEAERFEQALEVFTEVYNRTGEPKLLFNLGAAAEGMGDLERAEAYYRVYLEELPDAEDADAVRARIANLSEPQAAASELKPEKAPAEKSGAASAEETPPEPPAALDAATVDAETYYQQEKKPKKRGPVWQTAVMGVGGMVLAGGMISAIMAKNRYDGLEVACKPDCTDEQLSSARGAAAAADVLFAVGGVAVTAGVVGFVLYKNKNRRRRGAALRVTPMLSPDGAFLGAEGGF